MTRGAYTEGSRELAERVAVITGANQGLGERLAERFVREGAHVVLGARDAAKLSAVASKLQSLAVPGQRVISSPTDVTRERDVDALLARAKEISGRIEILVNCAGTAGPRGPIDEVDWDAWKDGIATNLLGTVYPCRAVVPTMRSQRYGKIVNISGGGATKPLPHLSCYAASKAGVVRFTETLAVELRDWNVDVNAVAPGVLYTKLVDDFVEAGVAQLGASYFEEVKRQRENGGPAFDLAAGVCTFLASARSDGISGRLVSANWDAWEDLAARRDALAKSDVYTLRRIVPGDRGLDWDKERT